MFEILSLPSPRVVATLFALLVSRCQRGREFRDLCCCRVASVSLCLVFSRVFSRCLCLVWFGANETQVLDIWCETYATLSLPYYLCLFSTVVSYELHAYPVLYPALIYHVLRIVGL